MRKPRELARGRDEQGDEDQVESRLATGVQELRDGIGTEQRGEGVRGGAPAPRGLQQHPDCAEREEYRGHQARGENDRLVEVTVALLDVQKYRRRSIPR